ncbi:hypothetical protein 10P302A_gene0050 [Pseudomonas phage 10P302A]|uniref:Uncharacterized protein n=1 Tax=Pseudomonas phage 10P302A TaxID=3038233 RepID=A0AAF0GJR9_9CAUD|nr:hypothetical protein 10P302A_gene0050 [Pseudomonas phage 10P302A]
MTITKKETRLMTVEKATVLLVLKRLALSRSTYKLLGTLLVALGVLKGQDVMGWVETLVCVASGGCGE